MSDKKCPLCHKSATENVLLVHTDCVYETAGGHVVGPWIDDPLESREVNAQVMTTPAIDRLRDAVRLCVEMTPPAIQETLTEVDALAAKLAIEAGEQCLAALTSPAPEPAVGYYRCDRCMMSAPADEVARLCHRCASPPVDLTTLRKAVEAIGDHRHTVAPQVAAVLKAAREVIDGDWQR